MNNGKTNVTGLDKTIATALNENLIIKKVRFAKSTFDICRRKTRQLEHWLGKRKIADVSATDLELMIAKWLKKYKGNTVNQYLDILRQVFARAKNDGVIAINPMDNIENCRFELDEPDPFMKHEIRALLQQPDSNPLDIALFQVGLSTGLRISELLALSVEAVNLEKRTLIVELALVGGAYKTPKTKGSRRTIELTEPAIEALRVLIAHAQDRKGKFISVTQSDNRTKVNPRRSLLAYYSAKRRAYRSVDEYREKFFKPFCESAGVRYRGPSQFRHTYASQLLSAGVNLEWIARQMGHCGTEMIVRHYGKWLQEDAGDFKAVAESALYSCFYSDTLKKDVITVSEATVPVDELRLLMTDPKIRQLLGLLNRAENLIR